MIPGRPVVVLDVFEHPNMEKGLSVHLNVIRENLVPKGLADIYWVSDHKITFEHKTMEQLLSEMGQRLDDQLRKHTQHADEVGLVVDGLVTPYPGGGCQLWAVSKTKGVFYKKGRHAAGFEELQAYLWRLDKEGITVYQFPDITSLCLGVSAFVYNSLKKEHKTLRRYVKTKPILWEPDPYLETLMGISGARIGEKTAQKLIGKWKTPFEVFVAKGEDVEAEIGVEVTKRLWKGIGRSP